MMNRKVVFIVGPTASGKTALSLELAERFGGEIISADSMQIYRGIHIASAAPNIEEMRGMPHHLIEFLEPNDAFSVADYVSLSRKKIDDILSRGKTPFVVGGTGLYISSLIDNISFIDEPSDIELRKKLEKRFDEIGACAMLEELSTFDKIAASKLHPNNKRRIIRAFEVFYTTGITITEQNLLSKKEPNDFESLIIGINFEDREKLYERINKRVDIMLDNGLLEEAEKTFKVMDSVGGFQAIGHKELYGYFRNEITLDEACENLKRQTRRYAKRQITWFNKVPNINWFYPDVDIEYLQKSIMLTEKFLKEE